MTAPELQPVQARTRPSIRRPDPADETLACPGATPASTRCRAGAGILLGIIRGKGPLRPRLDPRRGDDILSSYMASDVYLRLVHRLGWIAEDFQRWLEATLAWQLLGTG